MAGEPGAGSIEIEAASGLGSIRIVRTPSRFASRPDHPPHNHSQHDPTTTTTAHHDPLTNTTIGTR